jgi:hypothetical protein
MKHSEGQLLPDVQGCTWDAKTIKTAVKIKHFLINMESGHHLPVIQLVSFLELTQVSYE